MFFFCFHGIIGKFVHLHSLTLKHLETGYENTLNLLMKDYTHLAIP